MSISHFLLIIAFATQCGCQTGKYRYTEPFSEIDRKTLTTDSIIDALGQPARISHSSSVSKEGPPADTAYRYYFTTRDGFPGAKIFYFYQGEWTGENVLGGPRKSEFYRLLNPTVPSDRSLIQRWDQEHANVW